MTNAAKAFYQEMLDRVETFQVTHDTRDQVEAFAAVRDELTRKIAPLRKRTPSAGNADSDAA